MEIKSNIQLHQNQIRELLSQQLKTLKNSFDSLDQIIMNPRRSNILKVIENEEIINNEFNNIMDLIILGFIKAPLGKDLRRNIAYFQILKYILNIKKSTISILNFMNFVFENKLSKIWIRKINNEITLKLEILIDLIHSENLEIAYSLIKNDNVVKEVYNDVLNNLDKHFNNKKFTNSPEDIEKKTLIRTRIILTSKNYKSVFNNIKEIADAIIFIGMGNYESLR